MIDSNARAVLVTGGSGYLGRNFVRVLAEDRRGLDRIVATDVREVPESERIPGVVYEVLDVRDPAAAELFARHEIDTVVHLASIVSPGRNSSPELEYSVDVEGTRNVLAACVAAEVRKIVVTSSGAVYGYRADNSPLLDEDDPLHGHERFAYARHKKLVEESLAEYREKHPELAQLVFRPGTVLGADVSNQITAIFEKRIIFGIAGSATPFVFIWDEDVSRCLVEGVHGEKTGIYNLAGDGVMTLREIALALGKPFVALPKEAVAGFLETLQPFGLTRYGPEQVDFLVHRPVLSNARLKREFGYRPRKTTREVFETYRAARADA
jgi:UDP-glucose 4-epimerase